MGDIQEVIAQMGPLPGAEAFLDWLREGFQVVSLSDTFYEFAQPLMSQLGFPTLLCHRLSVAEDGRNGGREPRGVGDGGGVTYHSAAPL